MLPPLLTLSTAYVLKELLLRVIENRHADQIAFETALAEWKRAIAYPEQHPNFSQAYANELPDLLIKANRRSKTTRETIEQLDRATWRLLVQRELHTENWFITQQHESIRETLIIEKGEARAVDSPLEALTVQTSST